MDSTKAPSRLHITTPSKKTPASFGTPIKGNNAVSSQDQFWTPTPEKPTQLSRQGRNRSIAFSVKEVRQAALGLRKKDRRNDRSDRDLALLEEQLRSDGAVKSSPPKSKNQIKLPEKYNPFHLATFSSLSLDRFWLAVCLTEGIVYLFSCSWLSVIMYDQIQA